ncbi:hypothetical protein MTYP_00413 [Methylophilaceae bacterium]|nr:hypothetical protein MTYP_00413 [Methylophilaceae bacterium]
MNLNKVTLREQLLVLVTVVVIIGGIYGGLRFYPANKAIGEIRANTEMMDKAIRTGKIPDEPLDDIDTLKRELAELEQELLSSRNMVTGVERRLAPADTTEIRLMISEVARKALVRITANEEYRVMLPAPAQATGTAPATKAAAGNAPRKRLGDAAKRRLRNAQRAGAAGLGGSGMGVATVNPDQTTDLVRKLAINGTMERPMQRYTMEGTYAGMMRFIQGLEQMEKMATIVQFQLGTLPQSPPPGHNQRLSASMVLAF